MNPYAIMGAALLFVSITAWGYYERSGKLELEVEVVELRNGLEATKKLLGEQKASVDALKAAEKVAKAETARLLKQIAAASKERERERARLAAALAAATPAGAGCDEAWDLIESAPK